MNHIDNITLDHWGHVTLHHVSSDRQARSAVLPSCADEGRWEDTAWTGHTH